MRRPLCFAGALSIALASPAGISSIGAVRGEKPRVANAVASFLDSLVAPSARSQGPTCGCGSYVPRHEPTCGIDAFFPVEPLCGAEPVCGVDATTAAGAFGANAFLPQVRTHHAPVRMRIQSHPAGSVDRSFAPAHRLPPAPRLPSVEHEPTAWPAKPRVAPERPIVEPMPELPVAEPPVASTPLPMPEPMPESKPDPGLEPAPMPESPAAAASEPEPMPKHDPVQATPLPLPMPAKPSPPAPIVEEPEPAAVEESALPVAEASLPAEEFSIPAPAAEPLLTPPSAEAEFPQTEQQPEPLAPAPSAAKLTPAPIRLTPEPLRQPPARPQSPPPLNPLSIPLPYDPTDPFADPPATEAPATPTSGKRSPARAPAEPEILRFGEEEFAPVGTGVVIQPTSGSSALVPMVRPAIRIVPFDGTATRTR